MKYLISGIFFALFSIEATEYNPSLMPDFRFALDPALYNDQGISGIFETGRQIQRFNGTYGIFNDDVLFKISLEYLRQHLGFNFASIHEHHWVSQKAVGAALRFPLSISTISIPVDFAFNYSNAADRKLFPQIVPRENEICYKYISGSNGYEGSISTQYSFWNLGVISSSFVYNYIKFNRKYKKNKIVKGAGVKVGIDQKLFDTTNFHIGVDVQAPYVTYDARLSFGVDVFKRWPMDIAIYGERVHGFKSLPNSSRIGIEIRCDLEKIVSGSCSQEDTFRKWLSIPAIYSPEVLVIADKKVTHFNLAPTSIGILQNMVASTGEFVFDTSSSFTGSSPLIYSATGLPNFLTIDPTNGQITGLIEEGASGSFHINISATNYSGSSHQNFILYLVP